MTNVTYLTRNEKALWRIFYKSNLYKQAIGEMPTKLFTSWDISKYENLFYNISMHGYLPEDSSVNDHVGYYKFTSESLLYFLNKMVSLTYNPIDSSNPIYETLSALRALVIEKIELYRVEGFLKNFNVRDTYCV